MEAQHMNQQTFAKHTGIGTASLSSIFTGRTRPTMNHVLAIMETFPNVNPLWLLKGEGGMLLTNNADSSKSTENSVNNDDFPNRNPTELVGGSVNDIVWTDNMAETMPLFNQKNTSKPHSAQISSIQIPSKSSSLRKITEIRVFFDDQTWESFVPKNK